MPDGSAPFLVLRTDTHHRHVSPPPDIALEYFSANDATPPPLPVATTRLSHVSGGTARSAGINVWFATSVYHSAGCLVGRARAVLQAQSAARSAADVSARSGASAATTYFESPVPFALAHPRTSL
jgi:hypothetical protein